MVKSRRYLLAVREVSVPVSHWFIWTCDDKEGVAGSYSDLHHGHLKPRPAEGVLVGER